jgi:hypothetical protein
VCFKIKIFEEIADIFKGLISSLNLNTMLQNKPSKRTYFGLLIYRSPGTGEKRSDHYKKEKGSAQIHGQNFEYKFCALVFLRAQNKGYKFKLASNVKGLGAFDDVFV